MTKPRIRVLCVDDHVMVREGITFIIDSQPDMKVVAAAGSGEQAVLLFQRHHPDVTVMDLRLPGMSGVEAIRAIRRQSEDARIVVLTAHHSDDEVRSALDAGAVSCVFKDAVSYDLINVLRAVHAGERPMSAEVTTVMANRDEHPVLSIREREVLELMATGMRNKEIAATLRISELTIQAYSKRLFAKLDVNDRTSAVTVALRRGIIHLREW